MTSFRSKGNVAITKTGLIVILAALLFATSEPSFAARKSRKPTDNSATQQSEKKRAPAYDPQETSRNPFGPGRNLPYPDRPYGDPGRWYKQQLALQERLLRKSPREIKHSQSLVHRSDQIVLSASI